MSEIKYIKTVEDKKGNKLDVYANKPQLNDFEMDLFARNLGEIIAEYYQDPKNVAEYEKWQKKQDELYVRIKDFIIEQKQKQPDYTINTTILENKFRCSFFEAKNFLSKLEKDKYIKKTNKKIVIISLFKK